MNTSPIGRKAVAILLTALLVLHIFHLYTAWKDSRIAVVEAVYEMSPVVCAGLPGPVHQVGPVLLARLTLDNQVAVGFSPLFWRGSCKIHIRFALHHPEPERTLKHLEADLDKSFRDSLPPRPSAGDTLSSDSSAAIRLTTWSTSSNSGPKLLDGLSLVVLACALFLWLRGRDDSPSQ